jgi:hypothetical protein
MRLDSDMRCSLLALALLAALSRSTAAQVGHNPATSPYRSLRYGQFIGITGGYFNGTGGQIGVAPHQGATAGLRYDFLGAGTITVGLAASHGDLQRFIVDKNKPLATAKHGPIKQSATFFEGILQFNLTGGKTWHRLAPFVSAGLGVVLAQSTPSDTSGFTFKTKGIITPGIGARVFLSERLFLKLEARSTFWQVNYPPIYRATGTTDVSKEWLTSGWYTVGLHYAFHRPF